MRIGIHPKRKGMCYFSYLHKPYLKMRVGLKKAEREVLTILNSLGVDNLIADLCTETMTMPEVITFVLPLTKKKEMT